MATLEAEYGSDGLCWDRPEDEQVLCRATCTDALATLANAGLECALTPGEEWGIDEECQGDVVGTGYQEGDVAYDFTLPNQYGNETHLYSFCGHAVFLVWSAMWQDEAGEMSTSWLEEQLYDEYRDRGLMVVLMMGENEQEETPTHDDLSRWASNHDLTFPVLADKDWSISDQYADDWTRNSVIIKPGGEVFQVKNQGSVSYDDIEAALP